MRMDQHNNILKAQLQRKMLKIIRFRYLQTHGRRAALSSVFESEMGSSSSAASERWRSAARASASCCAFAGSSKYHGIHCDVGVDFSPVWRSYC